VKGRQSGPEFKHQYHQKKKKKVGEICREKNLLLKETTLQFKNIELQFLKTILLNKEQTLINYRVPVTHSKMCICSYNPVVVASYYQHLSWIHRKSC
jgi:hypothetical protein